MKKKIKTGAQHSEEEDEHTHTLTHTHTLETEEVSDVVSRALFVSLERSRRESALARCRFERRP